MRSLFSIRTIAFPAVVLFSLCSCERTTKTETTSRETERDTVTVSRTETRTEADQDVREFKDWVNDKTNRADSNARENWPEIKEDFKTRSAKLESRLDSLSADSRREYEEAKARYQAWENRRDTRTSKPLDDVKLSTWRKTMLGDFSDLKSITAGNVREAYLIFIGVVRAKKGSWTQDDWDYADHVYGQLNSRKSEIENNIATADRLKIKSLQAEYLALEASADAKDLNR